MKPVCNKVILVEGKYDKIRIESFLSATVLTTEGFGIFKNKEKRDLLKRLAKKRGLVILSDSDGAGKLIRSHVHTLCGKENIVDLYIPPTQGKEKRKTTPGKEGLLGVEGIDNQTLLALFEKSGLLDENAPIKEIYSKLDLYKMGYFGQDYSKEKREKVLAKNGLPKNLSSGAFLDAVNLLEIKL